MRDAARSNSEQRPRNLRESVRNLSRFSRFTGFDAHSSFSEFLSIGVRGERGSGGRCKAAAFLGRAAVSNCGRGLGFVSSKSWIADRAEKERKRERAREG